MEYTSDARDDIPGLTPNGRILPSKFNQFLTAFALKRDSPNYFSLSNTEPEDRKIRSIVATNHVRRIAHVTERATSAEWRRLNCERN